MVHIVTLEDVKHAGRKQILLWFAVITFIFALVSSDSDSMLSQYYHLMTHQTYLMHDFIAVAGESATFLNVSLHYLIAYILYIRNDRSRLNGLQIASIGIFVGHSFFGTHLLNIIPIMMGVFSFAHWRRQSFKYYTAASLFSTATAPLISFWLFSPQFSLFNLITASLLGFIMGFIAPPLAEHFLKFHQGFTIYNYGFTTGMIAMMLSIFVSYFHHYPETQSQYSTDSHAILLIYVLTLLLSTLIIARLPIFHKEVWQQWATLLQSSGRLPSDFMTRYGVNATTLNMTLTSLIYLSILLLIGMPLNGPVVGGLLSVWSFGSFGKHIRNTLPISMGVLIAAYLLNGTVQSNAVLIPLLFGTALAPIAGSYGIIWGVVAGFLQFNLVSKVFTLHSGFNLYNNGFSSGFIAAIMIPIIEVIQAHFEKDTY